MSNCTKPNCDCVEKAEQANGGNPIKSYPCLADNFDSDSEKEAPKTNLYLNPMTAEKTKEEILASKEGFRAARHIYHYTTALEAMQEYSDQQNAALIAEVKILRDAINYALPLMSAPPQHRKEFYATARAALRKALTTK